MQSRLYTRIPNLLLTTPNLSLSARLLPKSHVLTAQTRLAVLSRHFSDMATTNGTAGGTTSRLAELRKLMKSKQVDIYGTQFALRTK